MENVPPPMNNSKDSLNVLPTLDDLLLRPTRRNAKSARPKRTSELVLTARTNVDETQSSMYATGSGLLTPPSSQTGEDLADPPRSSKPSNAGYISPLPVPSRESLSSRRRSATPLPLYEPPSERFTPPREVLYTPPAASTAPKVSKSSRRKSTHKITKRNKKLTLLIKKEPPDIDLSLPPPPASPTDDPLLLSGPPRRAKPRQSLVSTYSRDTPPMSSMSPIHRQGMEDAHPLPLSGDAPSPDFNMSDDLPPLPAFNLENVVDAMGSDAWSDSDEDDGFDHSGEYTGKFKVLTVPTKADPPSSCTRHRMDAWGRPISPFPGHVRRQKRELDSEDEAMLTEDNSDECQEVAEVAEEVMGDGVVKITSDDGMTAARAAAILKMHDYDCIPRIPMIKRSQSHQSVDSVIRNARRKACSSSGILKRSLPVHRRHTLGVIVGDKVIIPGEIPSESDSSGGWTKNDWKRLDSCFTDERLAVAARLGLDNRSLAHVDDVILEDVVDRFIAYNGRCNTQWNRANVLERVRTLQRKQRSGKIAPPTPDATSTFHAVKLPAKTAQHAVEEQSTISTFGTVPGGEGSSVVTASPSIATRVRGFLSSYLPIMSKSAYAKKALQVQPSLPFPPPEVFAKPRPPISTPIPKPAPRPPHPKDLVNLHPVMTKASMIPRSSQLPQRLVELRPPPPIRPTCSIPISAPRRSSGGSVKDLIKSFEDLKHDGVTASRSMDVLPLRRHQSVGSRLGNQQKPFWKP
ncbi:hypothetical protein AcV5_000449 [Taiwanofungus camphoratus]|nr:hypothetical protein AcV5_000449 [Antrodia cinnamomea]